MRLGSPQDQPPRQRWSAGRSGRLHVVSAACSAVLVLAGVAACGSAADQAGTTAGSGTAAGGGTANGACAASGLKVTVDASAAGAAAGSTYYPIDFTNASSSSCRLDGYPVAWFATSAGQRIGTAAAPDRSATARPRPVSLRPGATAHAWLRIADAANYPVTSCRPVTAHVLLIRAPGAAGTSSVRRAFPACSAAMHGHGILTVQPVTAGRGTRGSA